MGVYLIFYSAKKNRHVNCKIEIGLLMLYYDKNRNKRRIYGNKKFE